MAKPAKQKTPKEWLSAIDSRIRVFKSHWYKDAKTAIDIYETENPAQVPFNILFSNTETMMPALFSQVPTPDISRRFGMDTGTPEAALNHAAAETANRFLTYESDTNDGEYDTYANVTTDVVFSTLLTGLGTGRVHVKRTEGYAEICFEKVAYNRFIWGWARTWKQVPWVAFGHDLCQQDFEALFPKALEMDWYKGYIWPVENTGSTTSPDRDDDKNAASLLVWEVWDALNKRVQFVVALSKEQFLQDDEYPFDLTSRFPCPEPVRLIKRLNSLDPIVPYKVYKVEAEQLQEMVKRYNSVTKAIKVRGVYDAGVGEITQILEDGTDNKLVPSESAGAFRGEGGLDKAIWMLPIDMLIEVANQMASAIEQKKGEIFEIMGIADIMRGASAASETLGAQQIKNQWGTLRLKRSQGDVQVFCRDFYRITLEFGAYLLTPKEMKAIVEGPYPLAAEQSQAQQAIAQSQMAASQVPPPMPGQPPSAAPMGPKPPSAALMAAATLPTMEAIMGLLKDRFARQYRIDIQTNSTLDAAATDDKADIGDFMNAFGQMMAGLSPLIEEGVMSFDVAKTMMIEVCRRFKFGRTVEDALNSMTPPQSGASQKKQADQFQQQTELMTQQHQLALSSNDNKWEQRVLQIQNNLVQVTGELEVAKVQLAQQDLAHAKDEIDNAVNSATGAIASGVKIATLSAKDQRTKDALAGEKMAHAHTKAKNAVETSRTAIEHAGKQIALQRKNLQPGAAPA